MATTTNNCLLTEFLYILFIIVNQEISKKGKYQPLKEFRYKQGSRPIPTPPPPPPHGAVGSSKLSAAKIEKPVGKVSPFTKEKGAGYTGLVNLGNTCFMASVLQCLGLGSAKFNELRIDLK